MSFSSAGPGAWLSSSLALPNMRKNSSRRRNIWRKRREEPHQEREEQSLVPGACRGDLASAERRHENELSITDERTHKTPWWYTVNAFMVNYVSAPVINWVGSNYRETTWSVVNSLNSRWIVTLQGDFAKKTWSANNASVENRCALLRTLFHFIKSRKQCQEWWENCIVYSVYV